MTAAEWLANELYEKFEMKGDGALFNDLLNQAKEMEKQQIMDACYFGHLKGWVDDGVENSYAEQYYKETFNK